MRYFCMKYNRWMSKREIEENHGGRCFKMRKGLRRGKKCRLLVVVP